MLQLAMFHDRFDGSKPILAIFRGMNTSKISCEQKGNQVLAHSESSGRPLLMVPGED